MYRSPGSDNYCRKYEERCYASVDGNENRRTYQVEETLKMNKIKFGLSKKQNLLQGHEFNCSTQAMFSTLISHAPISSIQS